MSDVDYTMSPIVLACPMDPDNNDAGASTVREYLAKIVREVWIHGECFSGKRPFGNSGWCWDIYQALVDANIVDYDIDDESLSFERRGEIDAWILGGITLMGEGTR